MLQNLENAYLFVIRLQSLSCIEQNPPIFVWSPDSFTLHLQPKYFFNENMWLKFFLIAFSFSILFWIFFFFIAYEILIPESWIAPSSLFKLWDNCFHDAKINYSKVKLIYCAWMNLQLFSYVFSRWTLIYCLFIRKQERNALGDDETIVLGRFLFFFLSVSLLTTSPLDSVSLHIN